jgi:plastocyanin
MNNKALITVIVIVILGGAALFFNRAETPATAPAPVETKEYAKTPAPPIEEATTNATTSDEVVASETKEFTVTGKNFAFDPPTITVNSGDRVKIIFKNSGGMHDWKIDEFNAATKRIKAGEEDTVEFIADKTGSFEYYCSVGTHRAMGMKGTLVVQ